MTLRTMQQRAPHLFAPQFSVDAENILKKVAKKFAGNKKVRIFLSLTLRYGYIYDISSPQTAVMAIWGL